MTSSKSFSSHSEPNPPICEVTEEIHWLHVHFQLVFYSGHSSQTCQARRNTIRTCSQVPCNQAANSQPPSIKPDGCLPLSQYLFSFQQICLRLAICLRLFARGLLQIAITVWAWSLCSLCRMTTTQFLESFLSPHQLLLSVFSELFCILSFHYISHFPACLRLVISHRLSSSSHSRSTCWTLWWYRPCCNIKGLDVDNEKRLPSY